ncbi:proteasomal ubiquitin receptor ADRM1 homolog isoform X2 [Polyergus mexicanus]|uniref:proteasomal ubiquitin receptor ADRM1 homolog isoform X2 n=1 Tax=Polyergus mexicanus TaxID=615972 RepID=UPI0038B516F6
MSSGALFGNNASRGASKNLVEFKAGKMTVKGKMVYPDTRKGQLYVYQSDDSLMHFCWKDRTTGVVEDDLIIFPDDCEFKHVPQCKTGRVYLLRFKSSSKKFFFWLQDLKTDKDEEHCRKINDVLNNPPTPGSQRSGGANAEGDLQNLLNNMSQQQLIQLFGGVGQIGGLGSLLGTMNRPHNVQSTRASTTTSSTPTTTNIARPPHSLTPGPNTDSKSSTRTPAPSTPATTAASSNNRIQLSDLQNFLSEIPTPSRTEPAAQIARQRHGFLTIQYYYPSELFLVVGDSGPAEQLGKFLRVYLLFSSSYSAAYCPAEGRGDRADQCHPGGDLYDGEPGECHEHALTTRGQPVYHALVSPVLPGAINVLVCFAVGPGGPCHPSIRLGIGCHQCRSRWKHRRIRQRSGVRSEERSGTTANTTGTG